jgi:hypothetical protein
MATLDGKKIKDTYKSLLKVGDNSTLDPTLQEVTDGEGNGTGLSVNNQGDLDVSGTLTTGSVSITGGTSADFIKGDGSLDSNDYATTTDLASLSSDVAADISALDTDLQAEAATRAAADIALQANIDVESANLSTLTVRVNDNENDINTANTNITNNTAAISTEATARQNADTSLQTNIDLEETARIAADTALQTSINTEVSNRTAADTALQTQITSNDSDITTLQTGKVPYTGATGSVNLGEHQLSTGQVTFDQTPTGAAGVGVARWNNTAGTLDLGLKGGRVTLQVGQEEVVRVVNGTGLLLQEAFYQVVKVIGAQGQRLQVGLAQANSDLNSATSIGIVTEDIANNAEGFVTVSGAVREINTTGSLQGETWADGDVLYLSPTVAGQITNVKPITPAHLIVVGYVEYAHQNHGKIFVKVDNGYEIDELHDVKVTNVTDGQILTYNSANGYWENTTAAPGGVTSIIAGDSISVDSASGDVTITNDAPDQIVSITGQNGSTVSGTYPNFTIDTASLEAKANKGVVNGYAPLDSGAKIPEAYLPDSIVGQLSYKGAWDASTNTPTLPDPTTVKGDYYVTSVQGDYLGLTYHIGDWVISNGTSWEQVDNTDAVTTVFGRLGAIVANESDYSAYYPLISDLNAEIAARTSGDAALQGQIDAITSNDIPATLARVTTNETNIADLQPRVTTNEGNIATNTANITANTNSSATNAVNISALDIQVTDNLNAIAALDASKQDNITAGSGIDITGNTITNTSPDQIVSISGTGSTTVTGTYPNFSVSSTGTEYTAGTGLQLVGTEFQNTAPDKTVSITGGDGVSVTGTYPNFTVESIAGSQVIRDLFSGTGSQTAFTLSGTPVNENYTQIYFNGVYQEKSGYTLANNVVTFTEAPAAGLDVEVISITTITILGEVSSVNGQIGDVVVNVPVDSVNGQTGAVSTNYDAQVISASTTAVKNTVYVFTADLTLTLPASPSIGDSVKISNLSGVDTCILGANGSLIMGVSGDLTLDNATASFELIYSGATKGWVIIGL